jgi:hypothetical protein
VPGNSLDFAACTKSPTHAQEIDWNWYFSGEVARGLKPDFFDWLYRPD